MPPIEWPAMTARLARLQRRLKHGVEVGGQEVEAVVRAPGRHTAAAVAAVVVGDHAVVAGQIVDLVGPDPNGAGDAVGQHDRIAVLGSEDLGVQAGAVAGTDRHRNATAAARRPGRIVATSA